METITVDSSSVEDCLMASPLIKSGEKEAQRVILIESSPKMYMIMLQEKGMRVRVDETPDLDKALRIFKSITDHMFFQAFTENSKLLKMAESKWIKESDVGKLVKINLGIALSNAVQMVGLSEVEKWISTFNAFNLGVTHIRHHREPED